MKKTISTSSRFINRAVLCTGAGLMMVAAGVHAAPEADGKAWYLHDSGITERIISISAAGEYAVASTVNGSLLEFRNQEWAPVAGWGAFKATNPFGSGGTPADQADRNQIRVAALGEGNFWAVSYFASGNFVQYKDDTFSTYASGTGQRSRSIFAFGDHLLIGRGNGAFGRISAFPDGYIDHRRDTKMDNSVGVFVHTAASSTANMWLGTANRLFRSTNGNASVISWTEMVRPTELSGSIQSLAAFENNSAYFTTYSESKAYLHRWTVGSGFDSTPLYSFGDDSFSVTGMYVQDDSNIWIVGNGGNLWYFNGETASRIDLGTTVDFQAISGTGEHIWVAGYNGQIYSTVQPIPEPGSVALLGLAGAAIFGAHRLLTPRKEGAVALQR